LVRQSTPIRVRFRPDGVTWYEFVGIIDALPTRWDLSQRDQWIPITASGTLKRALTNRPPARSRLYHAVQRQGAGLADHWPLEDGATASIAGSAMPNGRPLIARGVVDFGTTDGPPGAGQMPGALLNDSGQLFTVGSMGATPDWFIGFVFRLPEPETFTVGTILTWTVPGHSEFARFYLQWDTYSTGTLYFVGIRYDGTWGLSVTHDRPIDGDHWRSVLLGGWTDGTDVVYHMWLDGEPSIWGPSYSTGTNGTSGVHQITISPTYMGVDIFGIGPHAPMAFGGLYTLTALDDSVGPAGATVFDKGTTVASHIHEASRNRGGWPAVEEYLTVCARLGLTPDYTTPGGGVPDYRMGADPIITDVERLRAIEAVTGGVLYEVPAGALRLDAAADRTDQPVTLTLDYGAGDVAPPLEPVEDTTLTRNDVVASRPDGASARFVLDVGPTGTGSVGSHPGTLDVNPASDRALITYAGYAVARGTVDAERYPTVHVDLSARPALIADALAAARPSRRIQITNPPTGQGYYNAPDLMVEGFEIFFDFYSLDVVYNCTPYAPYVAFGLVDGSGAPAAGGVAGFLIPTTCVTAGTMTTTSGSVTMTSAPLWNTDTSNYPVDIDIDGEVMRVTAVAGASNPQTLTLTRSINGVVKTHAVDAEITIRAPGYLTMEV